MRLLTGACHTWWRHQMETFSALLAICAGNSPVTGEFHAQMPVTRSFDAFFDMCLNKCLSPLWCHCNAEHLWYDEQTLVPVMAWCHQARSHYLKQCSPSSMMQYGISRLQWIDLINSPVLGYVASNKNTFDIKENNFFVVFDCFTS